VSARAVAANAENNIGLYARRRPAALTDPERFGEALVRWQRQGRAGCATLRTLLAAHPETALYGHWRGAASRQAVRHWRCSTVAATVSRNVPLSVRYAEARCSRQIAPGTRTAADLFQQRAPRHRRRFG
jgi:hypothetical protein